MSPKATLNLIIYVFSTISLCCTEGKTSHEMCVVGLSRADLRSVKQTCMTGHFYIRQNHESFLLSRKHLMFNV